MSRSPGLELLNVRLNDDLARIAKRFKVGARLTLVVRMPSLPGDTSIVMTDDDLDLVVEEIRKRQAAEP